MEYYRSFNAEALELSKSLPEEQSELYKRYFVPLPLDLFSKKLAASGEDPSEEKTLKELAAVLLENLRIKFDLVIGSTTHVLNSGKDYIRVIEIADLTEEHLSNKMYKNADDRGVAFIHAHTKKIILIDVPAGKSTKLNILFANTDIPLVSQVLINTGRESSLELFEWYGSKTKTESLGAVLHEVTIGPYAKSEISMIHNEDERTCVTGFSKGRIRENANLKVNYIYNGGLNVKARNEISADGYQASSNVIEMIMGSADQKFDLNTIVANVDKDTVSDLDSKAVLMDSSVCLLKGFAKIGDDASGARSFVNERGILLDKKAYMSSIPGMSINNSNVKATHSSATAPVDEDLLFYLMSRGAAENVAQRLVVSGFFSSSIAKIDSSLVKEAVASLMHQKINEKKFGNVPKLDISGVWFDPKAVQAQGMFEGHYKYKDQ